MNTITAIEHQSLSKEQKSVIEAIDKGQNILVTGGAGTGKSFLLNYLKRNYGEAGIAITASTGIAAVNIGGSTIHSFSGIGLANMPIDQIISNLFGVKFAKIRKRILRTKILAIDEVSMISANLLEILDQVFRAVKQNDKVMGGMQILLFGDFLQLPPVAKYGDDFKNSQFCFHSQSWQELDLKIFNFKEIFRQNDEKFIKILNNLRIGKIDEEDEENLRSRIKANDNNLSIRPTILTSHNYKAEQINETELKKIPSQEQVYSAKYFGNDSKIELLKKNCLAQQSLRLKIGVQVMMIKNTYQKDGIINGSLGVVTSFSSKKNYPIVKFTNGVELTISTEEWVIEKFDENTGEVVVEAGVTQIPLILSYAITIHKSQGLTLDKISCDLSEIFSPGQAYVALSRARRLEDVFINSIDFKKITADKNSVEFYRQIELLQ